MRITLVIASLWGGGTERVVTTLANGWIGQGHEVSILTFERAEAKTYGIHPAIKVWWLDLLGRSTHVMEGLSRNFRRIRSLRRAIRESNPDVIVSFIDQTNVLTLLATRGLGKPIVISERAVPMHGGIGRMWTFLCRVCYPFADVLVCPTRASLAGFQAMTRVRGVAIGNPVIVPVGMTFQKNSKASGNVLMAMGRLVQEKGFDLLLQAFAQIAEKHPGWSLTIIGDGPLRAELQEGGRALKLDGRVHFAGQLADPFPLLRTADLFVFSSRFEGFGMALAEAMACGLPVVSFDCPEGPRDIIRDGIDGLLVPAGDVAALAATLDSLMSDPKKRDRLAALAPEVLERFSSQRILASWQPLLNELLAAKEISR